jgi:hypothetical protein
MAMSAERDAHSASGLARWASPLAWALFALALGLWASHAWRVRFLSDDAFISFRYAENLARGLGLVWNPGERVEGYTNFLWVLVHALGLRLGLAPEGLSQALGLASGAAVLAGAFLAGGRDALGRLRGAAAALALALNASFQAWSTSGLETMLFTALVWLATLRFLAERRSSARAPWVSGALFALAALTRPEGPLFAGLAGLALLAAVGRGAARPRAFVAFALAFLLPVLTHLAWRRAYYGDWLPNTFRAKVAGAWLEQGLAYLGLYQEHYHALFFAPLALVALAGARRAEAALLAAQLAAYLAYVLAVGGDRFEFRFLVVVLPQFTWLVVEGASALPTLAAARGVQRVLAAVALAALVAFLWTSARGGRWQGGSRDGIQPIAGVRAYAERRIAEGRFLREHIERGELPRDLVLCVGGAGAVPYYTRWTTVDRRGLNDRTIARLPVHARGVIAHERDAPHDYLVARRVAVFDYVNRLVWTREQFEGARSDRQHDGQPLRLRALELGDSIFAFATFVSDEELAALFPARTLLRADPPPPDAPK